MTMREVVASRPDVIVTAVTIFHPQLRDVLQPAGEKGKVLFVHRSAVECADFNTMKAPTHFCSLDFSAVCLTTGAGLMAAGGEHSELDIRPLWPSPASQTAAATGSTATTTTLPSQHSDTFAASSSSTQSSLASSSQNGAAHLTSRPTPRWHLRTPTGGSINNSICIQPAPSTSTSTVLRGVLLASGESRRTVQEERPCMVNESRHREKRRKEDKSSAARMSPTTNNNLLGAFNWRRDEPWGRPGEMALDGGALARNMEEATTLPAQSTSSRAARETANRPSNRGLPLSNTPDAGKKASATRVPPSSVRLLISNNDRSVKAFRLRPPTRHRNAHCAAHNERIESGLPGLSRTQTTEFPTCINHSSFSPDGRHVVSVGDTPDVFLFSVNSKTGELCRIATYTASSDASFSTTWSPDSMQFAVASQDGIVSVWDVRSSKKIAALQTSQASDLSGAGAARVVKWSPRGDVLAFSEHQNYIHIVDTTNFESVQRIRIPSLNMLNSQTAAGDWPERCNEVPTFFDSGRMEVDNHDSLLEAALSTHVLGIDSIASANEHGSSANLIDDFLGSTAPGRFAANIPRGDRMGAVPLPRPWMGGQLLRRSGLGTHLSRSTLDRALLGEWAANNRRNGAGNNLGDSLHFDGSSLDTDEYGTVRSDRNADSTTLARSPSPLTSLTSASRRPYAQSSAPTTEIDWQSELQSSNSPAVRTVDSILSGFGDVPERTSAVWSSLGGGSSSSTAGRLLRRRGESNTVDISGLTWDPEGDYLYVSTCELIARYKVVDLRRSFGQACLR